MKKILVAWIGKIDLNLAKQNGKDGLGAIADALKVHNFDRAVLLNNYTEKSDLADTAYYLHWLESIIITPIQCILKPLENPTNPEDIYNACVDVVNKILEEHPGSQLTFHLSSGTSVMHTVWVILAKTRFKVKLIQSSLKAGVKDVDFPFNISAEFIPSLVKQMDKELEDWVKPHKRHKCPTEMIVSC